MVFMIASCASNDNNTPLTTPNNIIPKKSISLPGFNQYILNKHIDFVVDNEGLLCVSGDNQKKIIENNLNIKKSYDELVNINNYLINILKKEGYNVEI